MDKHFDPEQIESYLLNQFRPEEKASFEQLIQQDPILESELQFQKEIIEAIRHRRKSELKARLDNIQVGTSHSLYFSKSVLISSAIALISLCAFITWLLISPQNQSKTNSGENLADSPKRLATRTPQKIQPEHKLTIEPELPSSAIPQEIQVSTPVEPFQENRSRPQASQTFREQKPSREFRPRPIRTDANSYSQAHLPLVNEAASPAVKAKHIASSLKEEVAYAYLPNEEEGVKGIFDGTNEVKLEDIAARNQLSYQYINGEVFLYNHKTKWLKINIKVDGEEKTFIYYEQEYYELNRNQIEVKELLPISDTTLVQKLDQQRIEVYGK